MKRTRRRVMIRGEDLAKIQVLAQGKNILGVLVADHDINPQLTVRVYSIETKDEITTFVKCYDGLYQQISSCVFNGKFKHSDLQKVYQGISVTGLTITRRI